MSKSYKTFMVATAAVLATACGAQSEAEIASVESFAAASEKTVDKKNMQQGYVKPGASVTMEHDFKGFVQPGSTGTVRVTFKPSLEAGTMDVKAKSNGEISLSPSSTQKTFELDEIGAREGQTMNVAFSTQAPGQKYINFQVYTTDAAGQTMGRAFTIPIQVGDPKFNVPEKSLATIETTPSGERLNVMDAEETIK